MDLVAHPNRKLLTAMLHEYLSRLINRLSNMPVDWWISAVVITGRGSISFAVWEKYRISSILAQRALGIELDSCL